MMFEGEIVVGHEHSLVASWAIETFQHGLASEGWSGLISFDGLRVKRNSNSELWPLLTTSSWGPTDDISVSAKSVQADLLRLRLP